jgi:hypothetical protein
MGENSMSLNEDVPAMLTEMTQTFRDRNSTYGDNYLLLGRIMAALYPDGITLKTEDDFIRYHWLDWAIGKLTRWVRAGMNHDDSIKDAAVYLTMLAAWSKTHER